MLIAGIVKLYQNWSYNVSYNYTLKVAKSLKEQYPYVWLSKVNNYVHYGLILILMKVIQNLFSNIQQYTVG